MPKIQADRLTTIIKKKYSMAKQRLKMKTECVLMVKNHIFNKNHNYFYVKIIINF